MFKQVFFTLIILAGIGFLFNSCEDKNPTFNDPCPADTCPPYDITKPEPDSSGDTSSSKKEMVSAVVGPYRLTSGGKKEFLTGSMVEVKAYEITVGGEKLIAKESAETPRGISCLDSAAGAYFKEQDGNYFESQRVYKFVADTFNFDGKKYYGKDKISIIDPSDCEWFSSDLEVKEVN